MTPQNVHARNPNKMMSLQPALVAKPHKKFQSTLAMSSISLEDFDKGGADPLASMEALNAVVPRKEITKLIKQSSDAEGIKQSLWHVGCMSLCAAVTMIAQSLAIAPLWWAGMLGMAFVASFFFMPLHETVHRSAFKTRMLNDICMHIAGFVCLRPALHYFYYHWAHHKFTGDKERDSELQPSLIDMDVNTLPGYLAYMSGVPFWLDAVSTTVKHALGQCPEPYLASEKVQREVREEARAYLALYLGLLAGGLMVPALGSALLTFWVLPSLLGQPMLRFYLFGEHRGCQSDPHNILCNTRSMTTNWLYRKMAWQMPYHVEHHAWPYVPFHKLEDANRLIQEGGGVPRDGCAPTGEMGYVRLNLAFIKQLVAK